jgi:hypothetical protein
MAETVHDSLEPRNYIYETLDDSDEIRLLYLHPSLPLKCDIRHVKLSDKPAYDALSYMWGPADNDDYISLNGKRCRVSVGFSQ